MCTHVHGHSDTIIICSTKVLEAVLFELESGPVGHTGRRLSSHLWDNGPRLARSIKLFHGFILQYYKPICPKFVLKFAVFIWLPVTAMSVSDVAVLIPNLKRRPLPEKRSLKLLCALRFEHIQVIDAVDAQGQMFSPKPQANTKALTILQEDDKVSTNATQVCQQLGRRNVCSARVC